MKKWFNHTKRPIQKFNEYEEDRYEWEEWGEQEESEEIESAGTVPYETEDAEMVYYSESNEAEYAWEADAESPYYEETQTEAEGGYYAEETDAEGQEYMADAATESEYYAEVEEPYYGEDVQAEGEYYAEETPIEGEYYTQDVQTEGEYYLQDAPIEGEYYAEGTEEDGQYFVEDAQTEGIYYAEDAGEESQYYEEGAQAEDEYYAEEVPVEGEYYAEGQYYAEEEQAEDTYYDEDAYYEQNGDDNLERYSEEEQKAGLGILNFFRNMGVMDRVVAVTGVAVLLLALVTGGVFLSQKKDDNQVSAFADVGIQLEGIELIGEQGLLAVADAEKARMAAAEALKAEQEQQQGYDEEDYKKEVTVSLNLVSVQKDLKIKFTNKESGKLISNVPFVVTVTDPDGKNTTWMDDDLDGIIYKKGITPGKYQVKVENLADEKYASYKLPSDASKVEVKKEIVYQKIDVSNEIKKETEVNAAQEDTKKNETVVESALQDTVTWVESSVAANTYIEVAKNTIPDPKVSVAKNVISDPTVFATQNTTLLSSVPETNARSMRLTNFTAGINPSSQSLAVGGSITITAECANVNMAEITWTSSAPNVATVVGNGATAVVTAVAPGNAAISYTANGTAVSGGDAVTGLTGTCMVTVSDVKGTITVDNPNITMQQGTQAVVNAAAAGFAPGKEIAYTLRMVNPQVASADVDANGRVVITSATPGDAVITVIANYVNGGVETAASIDIKVKVINNLTMTLDKTEVTVYTGETFTIYATIPNTTTEIPVTAEISDTTVATVAVDKHAVVITGVKAGNAVVTVKYVQNGMETSTTCAVTVKANPKADTTTKLKDNVGNQLYVLEGNTYREAVIADYYTADKFFIKGDVKYTGWQTIDGKVYFFDGTGKKVTGEQVIQGAKYNFASDGSLVTGNGTMGIDVSKWNGNIDWKAVKNSGVSYVIIRCGYRGSSKGALIEDPKFRTNIEGAIAAGLKVGVYFFTQAVDEVEAVEEASMVLSMVSKYRISYPIFLDVEPSGGRGDKIDKATRTAVCKAFCRTIQEAGYTAGIYANKTWLNEKLDASALSSYKIWLAQYAATPSYKGKYDLWQYKSTGRVSGISGDVDLNLSYLGY